MSDHVFDELPLLLTGDADRATAADVTAHLRECNDCRDELISALLAHASLSSASRYAHDLVDLGDDGGEGPPTPGARVAPTSLPDLSAVFEQVRREVDEQARPTHRRRPSRLVLVAAAAVIAVGVGGGVYLGVGGTSGAASRPVALSAFDQGSTSASARLVGDNRMVLDASTLPRLTSGSYYEVWLTNSARTSMAPIGVLGSDGRASFEVPATEMSTYAAIEVSVQDTSGIGSYSGHSVLRGSYA